MIPEPSSPAPQGPVADHRLLLVTGASGAGRSTAIHALEDLGFETIDNLPLTLVPRLVDGAASGRALALGLDVRNRDFNVTALIELIDRLTRDARVQIDVLYLDCAQPELIRRYGETRRRHPLAPDGDPVTGIDREIDLLASIRARADVLIDTTDLNVHDLKGEIARWFGGLPEGRMAVLLQSFSYKRGVPRGMDWVFDCRFLQNPHWVAALRDRDGRDPEVAAHVAADPRYAPFTHRLHDLIAFLLPAQIAEGKAHLTVGFGCTGGQHRSVAVVEMLANALADEGWPVSKRHRELERRSTGGSPPKSG